MVLIKHSFVVMPTMLAQHRPELLKECKGKRFFRPCQDFDIFRDGVPSVETLGYCHLVGFPFCLR